MQTTERASIQNVTVETLRNIATTETSRREECDCTIPTRSNTDLGGDSVTRPLAERHEHLQLRAVWQVREEEDPEGIAGHVLAAHFLGEKYDVFTLPAKLI